MVSKDADISDVSRRKLTAHRVLTAAEEVVLAKRIERGDLAAKRELVAHNMRLVAKIAGRYPFGPGHHFEFEDLLMEGVVGLTRAAEKFDYRKGFKFSTYATWWIKQSIVRAIADKSRGIRLPVHILGQVLQMYRVRDALTKEMGCEPSNAQIAERLDVPVQKVEKLIAADQRSRPDSTDAFEQDPDEGGRPGQLPSTSADLVESEALDAIVRDEVLALVGRLSESEAIVIHGRFLDPKGPRTLESIAQDLGVSRERVRQIERDALKRLKEAYGGSLRELVEEGAPDFPPPPEKPARKPPAKPPHLSVVPPPSDQALPGSREWYLERLQDIAARLDRPPAYLDLMKAEGADGFAVSGLYGFWDSIPTALAEAGVLKAQEVEVA